jgi:Rps23 Pro-64 3,4-dihydroxylase Tpa1-like proline 4-hydroxylase
MRVTNWRAPDAAARRSLLRARGASRDAACDVPRAQRVVGGRATMINPQLPVAALQERFARERRIVIDQFLQPAVAEALYACLLREVPWEIAFRRGRKVITLTQTELQRLPQRELDQLLGGIQQQAQTDFQFVYSKFSMVDAYQRQVLPQLLTHRLLEALAAPATLELMRQITGHADIKRVDAQATLYRPGNFLTVHTDDHDGAYIRRAAYVIQLCKDWRADWGGLLHFLDARGDVEQTFVPRFNTLALFSVPTPHIVSMVAAFAPGPRFGITGWFTS